MRTIGRFVNLGHRSGPSKILDQSQNPKLWDDLPNLTVEGPNPYHAHARRQHQLCAYPMCATCAKRGRVTTANIVDQVRPLTKRPLFSPLSGVMRTCPFAPHMSAFDPKRTSPLHSTCPLMTQSGRALGA